MIVHIVGKGSGWEDVLAETEGELWFINYWHPKADILFEIHAEDHPYHEKLKREVANAKAMDIPVISSRTFDMGKAMAILDTDYFSCSPCWAIAYAILDGRIEEIHLWGCSMSDKGDHFEKRAGLDFWCGYAIGGGIKVVVHGNSTVMTTEDGLTYGTFKPMKRSYRHENNDLNTSNPDDGGGM
jgi:hypothetical protein